MSNQYTEISISDIPNHTQELSKADSYLKSISEDFRYIHLSRRLTAEQHTKIYEEIVRVLDYVGRLSVRVFEITDEFNEIYAIKYIKTPELGKKLLLEHTEQLHKPYDVIKNKCHKMLDELDDEYRMIHRKNPPNYNCCNLL
jgi:hypothetical protein